MRTRTAHRNLPSLLGGSSTSSHEGSLQAFIEKRWSLRIPLFVLEVKWKKYNRVFIGRMQNISVGGLLMSTEHSLHVGERFPVEFILPDQKTKIQCTGEVVWTRPYAGEGAGSESVGVHFVDIGVRKMKAIGQWIKKQMAQEKKRA